MAKHILSLELNFALILLIDMDECTNTRRQVTGGGEHEDNAIDNTTNGLGTCIPLHITESITEVAKISYQYVHLYV